MIKTLVTGITGLLGKSIIIENNNALDIIGGYFPEKNFETLNTLLKKYLLDIRDYEKLQEIIINEKIEYIIHCASLANVDYVETHKEEAYQNNFQGTKNIVELCKRYNIKIIFISTNAVYDGNNPPYSENALRNPINYYGKLKVLEEDYVMSNLTDYVIIRPILMYGWNDPFERENPLTWQIRMQEENKEILLVDDIFCNPLLANDCARLIIEIIRNKKFGIYNIGGPEKCSRFEFGIKIAELSGYDINKIKSVHNSFFKSIAPRPVDTTMDNTKIKKEFNVALHSIDEFIKNY